MSKITDIFDRASSNYDDWYIHPRGKQVFDAECKLLDSLIPSEGIGLEIGSGTGIFSEKFTNPLREVICLDISKGMLTKSIKRGLHIIRGSANNLPLKNNLIDFSYMVTVIEFLNNPLKMFREVKKVLRPNAPLTILFINKESSWGELYSKLGKENNPVFSNAHIYSYDEILRKINESGFKPIKSIGTLTTRPEDFEPGDDLVEPSSKAGVIAIKSIFA
ncbi:class I SAM-dependent methyltransferase [Candidatus Bathyarchaeota archaeon]|nr:class I SAM-dependent methyltransferase [Candidatus Bathyarchaeota archaeon]